MGWGCTDSQTDVGGCTDVWRMVVGRVAVLLLCLPKTLHTMRGEILLMWLYVAMQRLRWRGWSDSLGGRNKGVVLYIC